MSQSSKLLKGNHQVMLPLVLLLGFAWRTASMTVMFLARISLEISLVGLV